MATRTKQRARRPRPIQHPKRREQLQGRRGLVIAAAVGLLTLAGLGAFLMARTDSSGSSGAALLPDTPDYHSLLVGRSNPQELVLGTHYGLYRSSNGGQSWDQAELSGQDAMNLAQPTDRVVWAAGHNVLARSTDGGSSWADIRPVGLPSLDVHGFTVDPSDPKTLYAAVAGQGLYRSADGGKSFALVSKAVGPAVMALAVTPGGHLLAGDMEQGLLTSNDGGKSWHQTLAEGVMGIAINPDDPTRAIATASGIFMSNDQGESWREVLPLAKGGGPVAWSPSNPKIGYVVSFDRTLYKTTDGGSTWQPVT